MVHLPAGVLLILHPVYTIHTSPHHNNAYICLQVLGKDDLKIQHTSVAITLAPSPARSGRGVYNTTKSHLPIGQVLKPNVVSLDCRTVLLVNDMQSEYISRNIQLRYIYTGSFQITVLPDATFLFLPSKYLFKIGAYFIIVRLLCFVIFIPVL